MSAQSRLSLCYAWLWQHRPAVWAAWAALFALALFGGLHLRLDTSSTAFFPDDPPALGRMAKAMDMTPFSQLLFVDLHLQADAAKAPDRRATLARAATAVLDALPAQLATRADEVSLPTPAALLSLVPSLSNSHEFLAPLSDKAQVEQALRALREQATASFGPPSAWLRADPFALREHVVPALPLRTGFPLPDPVHGYMFNADNTHLLLPLRPASSMHDADGALALMDALDGALRDLPPGISASVVGGHRHTAANTRAISADIERLVLLSFAGFALVYLFLVRSRSALWLLLVPAAAALCATGSLPAVWPMASGLALGFGASVLGLAEDYAVHVHFTLRADSPVPPALRLARLTPPLVQSMFMSCSGFAVLLFSGIPAVRQLAFFAIISLFTGLALALTLLPLCPWHRSGHRSGHKSEHKSGAAHMPAQTQSGPGVPRHPDIVRTGLVAACLLLILLTSVYAIRIDVSPRTMGADMAELEAESARFQSVWGGKLSTTALVVHAPDEDAALSQAYELSTWLRAQGADVVSLTDILPPKAEAARRTALWQAELHKTAPVLQAHLEELGPTYGFAPKAFTPFRQWLNQAAQPASPALLDTAGLGALKDVFLRSGPASGTQDNSRVLLLVHGPVPALPPIWNDTVIQLAPQSLEAALREALRREGRLMPILLVLTACMLIITLRRPGTVLLAALPPLAAMSGVLGWMAISGTPLTLAAMTALPLTLSLALDHGLVVTHDLTYGADLGLERAMLVSSLTSILGMGLLALAEHPALKDMGQVIVIGLSLEFIVARWLLPRLCRPGGNGV